MRSSLGPSVYSVRLKWTLLSLLFSLCRFRSTEHWIFFLDRRREREYIRCSHYVYTYIQEGRGSQRRRQENSIITDLAPRHVRTSVISQLLLAIEQRLIQSERERESKGCIIGCFMDRWDEVMIGIADKSCLHWPDSAVIAFLGSNVMDSACLRHLTSFVRESSLSRTGKLFAMPIAGFRDLHDLCHGTHHHHIDIESIFWYIEYMTQMFGMCHLMVHLLSITFLSQLNR